MASRTPHAAQLTPPEGPPHRGVSSLGAQSTLSLELKCLQPRFTPLAGPHTHHSFAEGSSSAAAATTFNTDKGVQAIKKCLSCPSEGAKKENKNYLPVKEHMDPELRSLSHHRAL